MNGKPTLNSPIQLFYSVYYIISCIVGEEMKYVLPHKGNYLMSACNYHFISYEIFLIIVFFPVLWKCN